MIVKSARREIQVEGERSACSDLADSSGRKCSFPSDQEKGRVMYPIPLFVLDILPSLSYVQGDEPYPCTSPHDRSVMTLLPVPAAARQLLGERHMRLRACPSLAFPNREFRVWCQSNPYRGT
jgi:hypothetical protein